MGERFQDLAELDWNSYITENGQFTNRRVTVGGSVHPRHMSSSRRVRELLARGFAHLWFDDNWRGAECYSFNLLCSPLQPGEEHVPYLDHFGATAYLLSAEAHAANVRFFLEHLEAYFEFPPIFDGCGWDPEHALLSREVREDPYQYLSRPDRWEHVWGPAVAAVEHRALRISLHPPYVKLRLPGADPAAEAPAACTRPGTPGAPPPGCVWRELHVISCIDEASFGEVLLAKRGHDVVCIKRCRNGSDGSMTKEQLQNFEREINAYRTLRHPGITSYLGCILEQPNLAVVLEHLPNGNVFDLLYMNRINVTATIRLKIASQ
ncbi:unnamed protein product, partial [Prorocentrum cordatum]